MIVNPYIENAIKEYIQGYLTEHKSCTLWDLLKNYTRKETVTESELRTLIYKLLDEGYLRLECGKNKSNDSIIQLYKPIVIEKLIDEIKIIVSKPNLKEVCIQDIEDRNQQIDSIECFRLIISSSQKTLRICSPFIQYNVVYENVFPDFKDLLINALNNGVEVKLLTRELNERNTEVQWIVDIAERVHRRDNLSIVDYHLRANDGSIISSTHAKMLIADYDVAYIGSAELRKNSLITNLEIGCMIKGSSVFGICEIFDFMFSQGDVLL